MNHMNHIHKLVKLQWPIYLYPNTNSDGAFYQLWFVVNETTNKQTRTCNCLWCLTKAMCSKTQTYNELFLWRRCGGVSRSCRQQTNLPFSQHRNMCCCAKQINTQIDKATQTGSQWSTLHFVLVNNLRRREEPCNQNSCSVR